MSKKAKATDPARFEGNGISYRAKMIGIEDVPEARGDKMCQEMIQQLKGNVKASGQHKQRVFINVTLEGLKIIDAVSMNVLHTHQVHQISFISRDVTDSRAFGYIFGPGDGTHKFFGIKTANAAENLVLTLRDLFQTVYELKKQEIDEAKAKAAAGTEAEGDTTKPQAGSGESTEGEENIYQGIEQIKNLEFDELTQEEAPRQPVSPTSQAAPVSPPTSPPTSPATSSDPWGLPAPTATATTAAPASSSLSDLEQLSNPPPQTSNPFGGMQAFPGTPAPSVGITAPGFGMTRPGLGQPGMFGMPGQQPVVGLPVTRDPFGTDPFQAAAQPRQQAPVQMMAVPGAGAPFGQQPGFGAPAFPAAAARVSPIPGHPFHGTVGAPGAGMQPGFGMAQPGFTPFGTAAPMPGIPQQQAGAMFPEQPDENLLQPLKPGGKEEPAVPKPEVQKGLFDDLLDIKKSAGPESGSKSPKEMFKDLSQAPKKSLNEMKGSSPTPKASVAVFDQDPFADDPFGSLDAVLNSVASSSDPDPFNPHYVPPSSVTTVDPFTSSSTPASSSNPSQPPQPPAPPDPSPSPDVTLSANSSKESSPETRFDMPDEPPPPLPSHLKVDLTAPSPPPRPPPIPSRPMPKPRKTPPSSPATSSSLSSSVLPTQTHVNSLITSPEPPPPVPSSPRPTSSITTSSSSSPAIDLPQPSAIRGGAGITDAWGFNSSPVPSRPSVHVSSSPSPSWDSLSNLSHSSSQKSLDRTAVVTTEADDPFGVPLRSKKSISSTDGASSKRSSRSSGKLSVKLDSKSSVVAMDPFGLPLTTSTTVATERTNSCDGGVVVGGETKVVEVVDNPFSVSVFHEGGSASSQKWEAFGDHTVNGGAETITTNCQPTASPFGDAFFPPVNGK